MLFSENELKVINDYQKLVRNRLDTGALSMSKLQDPDYYNELVVEYNLFLNKNVVDNFNLHDYYAPSILINLTDKNIYTSLYNCNRLCSENFLKKNLDIESIGTYRKLFKRTTYKTI